MKTRPDEIAKDVDPGKDATRTTKSLAPVREYIGGMCLSNVSKLRHENLIVPALGAGKVAEKVKK